jgi:hypothetical protein
VRPNSGKIEPGETVDISGKHLESNGTSFLELTSTCVVVLQPMREDPPPDARCRDKFLVQSVLMPANKELSNVCIL